MYHVNCSSNVGVIVPYPSQRAGAAVPPGARPAVLCSTRPKIQMSVRIVPRACASRHPTTNHTQPDPVRPSSHQMRCYPMCDDVSDILPCSIGYMQCLEHMNGPGPIVFIHPIATVETHRTISTQALVTHHRHIERVQHLYTQTSEHHHGMDLTTDWK